MKTIFKIEGFGGGAPLSLLEYGVILQKHGFTTFVDGTKNIESVEKRFTNNGFGVSNSDNLRDLVSKRRIFNLIASIFKLYDKIRIEKYDLLVSVSTTNIFFDSYIAKCLGINHLIVIAGRDISKNIDVGAIKYWTKQSLICFSRENYEALIDAEYPKECIEIISNRITCAEDINWISHYLLQNDDSINMLLTSRLDKEKMKSVEATIELARWLHSNDVNIKLKIAGTGEYEDVVREKINQINQEQGKKIVEILGHVDNISEEFSEAHLVFGKGRSVIEPIMMNRIGFVVGDKGEFSECNLLNIDNLYHYNFAGRNITNRTSNTEIMEIINNIKNGSFNVTEYETIFKTIKEKYHSDYLEEKLMSVINNMTISKRKFDDKFMLVVKHKIGLILICLKYLGVILANKFKFK